MSAGCECSAPFDDDGCCEACGTPRIWRRKNSAGETEYLDDLFPRGVAPAVDLPTALLPGARLLDTEFPPIAFAIRPFFPMREVAEVVGPHAVYKSTIMLYACLSVATGRPWGLHPVVKGRSVFITMEDVEATIARRVRMWLRAIPEGPERAAAEADVRENFAYLPREKAEALALTVTTGRDGTVARPEVIKRISALVAGRSLVVLETATRLHDGPEDNTPLKVFALAVERIAGNSGASVAVVRHTTKQGARDNQNDSYSGRGGGSFADAARSVVNVSRVRDEKDKIPPGALVEVKQSKATHTADGELAYWRPLPVGEVVYLEPVSVEEAQREAAQGQQAQALSITLQLQALAQEHAARAVQLGNPEERLTSSKLSAGLYRQVRGLAKHGVKSAVEAALSDGAIHPVPRPKGGSYLLPGPPNSPAPGELREGSPPEPSPKSGSTLPFTTLPPREMGGGRVETLPASPPFSSVSREASPGGLRESRREGSDTSDTPSGRTP